MLPNIYCQRYQELKQALEQMHQSLVGGLLNPQRLRQNFLEAQQIFQQQIVSLDASDLEPADEPRVRSYQTEMSKQLRLLAIDVMFLQAARQSETVQQRQIQLGDRIQALMGYCDALLE